MAHWSKKEVDLIVADYFSMLTKELAGIPYSKSGHRKLLMPRLTNRSKGSIEFKHQNISAVLNELGLFAVKGYKRRSNYQNLLMDSVIEFIQENKLSLNTQFENFSNMHVNQHVNYDFNQLIVQHLKIRLFRNLRITI